MSLPNGIEALPQCFMPVSIDDRNWYKNTLDETVIKKNRYYQLVKYKDVGKPYYVLEDNLGRSHYCRTSSRKITMRYWIKIMRDYTHCERCKQEMNSFKISWFNTEHICNECVKKESQHLEFKHAREVIRQHEMQGDKNFEGIGLPNDLKKQIQKILDGGYIMTRGTFVYVDKDKCCTSTEFNGDMYLNGSGHGEDAVKTLLATTNLKSFKDNLQAFNSEHHCYSFEEVDELFTRPKKDVLFFGKRTYIDKWFSDYLYIVNKSDEDLIITDANCYTFKMPPNYVLVINFGRFYVLFDDKGNDFIRSDEYLRANSVMKK